MVMNVLRAKSWYKFLTLFLCILSTPLVLYLFSLQLSAFVTLVLMLSYAGLLFLALESFIVSVKISENKLSTIYFNVNLNDIIEVKDGLFETKIRTRWRVYRLPPIKDSHKILQFIKNV